MALKTPQTHRKIRNAQARIGSENRLVRRVATTVRKGSQLPARTALTRDTKGIETNRIMLKPAARGMTYEKSSEA